MRPSALLACVVAVVAIAPPCEPLLKDQDSTDVANEPDSRPLLFATLRGGMVALEQTTGNILWTLKDEPVVRVPNENLNNDPQFLPDPRHGSLYMFGTRAGERQILKKLPFTIPQLVANAPCRSSDGILYTGKKIDTWFMIDPKTGIRKKVLGQEKSNPFEDTQNTCPLDPKNAVYMARTEYNILMYDSKNKNSKWNVTFFDYSSHNMGSDMLNNYGIVHFTSTSNGRITSFDRKTGQILWSRKMESPIIAAYLLDREGLISVPFNTVGDDTMDHIIEDISSSLDGRGLKNSQMELFPSLYIGEHNDGLYALSSLVDKSTITINAEGPPMLLLEGPNELKNEKDHLNRPTLFKQNINVHYNVKKLENGDDSYNNYLLLGHYSEPQYLETSFKVLSRPMSVSWPINYVKSEEGNNQVKLIMGPTNESDNWIEIENKTGVLISEDASSPHADNKSKEKASKSTVGSQTDFKSVKDMLLITEIKVSGFVFSIGMIITIGITVAFVLNRKNQVVDSRHSQNSSRQSSSTQNSNGQPVSVCEELDDGAVRIGKITFYPDQILGKGCDGTFVYRGCFENRDVAVKRLLPDCFSFADREVALLTESDTHINVIRYFCMEQDKLFRYIALELCSATLQDYIRNNLELEYNISRIEVLKQATAGLAHLHSLDIVHRDVKPQNVLLSVPNPKSPIRVMISDFGLCKKLNIGRNSFSRRSGVTGTDGWIAPEMLRGQRTTTSVDIFSLGCVFYYVLSKGKHPFGDVLERQANILRGDSGFDHLSKTIPEEEVDLSICLIKSMLSIDPQSRPEASVVKKYPLFWTKKEILTFFQDVSDRVEKDSPGGPLEYGALAVVRGDWRGRVCSSVASDLRKYRSYSGDSVRDLLRALRNKKHHYRELTEEAQLSLGSIPNDFTLYWLKRFPKLLLHTWLQMQTYKNDVPINMYYDEHYEFDNNYIIDQMDEADMIKYQDESTAQNNLFVKSRNFYDHVKGKKIKFRQGYEKRVNKIADGGGDQRGDQKLANNDQMTKDEKFDTDNNQIGNNFYKKKKRNSKDETKAL